MIRLQKRLLQDRLAMAILEGRFTEGDTVEMDVEDQELVLEKAAQPAEISAAS